MTGHGDGYGGWSNSESTQDSSFTNGPQEPMEPQEKIAIGCFSMIFIVPAFFIIAEIIYLIIEGIKHA